MNTIGKQAEALFKAYSTIILYYRQMPSDEHRAGFREALRAFDHVLQEFDPGIGLHALGLSCYTTYKGVQPSTASLAMMSSGKDLHTMWKDFQEALLSKVAVPACRKCGAHAVDPGQELCDGCKD